MLHPRAALPAGLCLMFLLAGCTPLVDEPLPAPTATAPDSGPSLIPEVKVFRIDPAPRGEESGPRPPTHADLIEQGKSPLSGARPGSEKVLMHFHGKGDARIVLPHQRSGALLWLLVHCESPSPLTMQSFDLRGIAVVRYDLEPCGIAEGGGGAEDGTSTFVQVWTGPNVEYDLTVISSEEGTG